MKSTRHHGLDTLRALAILLVFAYHYQVFVSHEPTFGWLSTVGWAGVDLFFVLSGYLIANQLFAGIVRGQHLSLPMFFTRRLLRTLPNYYVLLALYFLFPAVMGGREPPPLWRFLTFTQNLGLRPGTAFSHAWSLCVEEQFYLLLPVVVLLALRFRRSVGFAWALLALLMVAGIATRSWLWLRYGREATGEINGYHPNIYYSSFCRFDEFLPGVAVALLKNFHRETWQRITGRGHAVLAVGVLCVAALFVGIVWFYEIPEYGYGYFMTGFGYSLLACAFALLVVAALSPDSWLHRVRVPGAAHLAAWSYAIYLSHKPLAGIMNHLLAGWGVASWLTVPVISAVCLLGGWLLYRLVETPFMKLRDRRFPSNFTDAPAASSRSEMSTTDTRQPGPRAATM